jgi:E3 SUMO-protein ligase PIAS1
VSRLLTQHQIGLSLSISSYQLRLFCTSSTFFSPNAAIRTFNASSPIEFPPTCEVRVNSVPLTASLKGLKKKPGTAPPPDLGKFVRLNTTQNRIEMIYVNSQQPTQPKVSLFISLYEFNPLNLTSTEVLSGRPAS